MTREDVFLALILLVVPLTLYKVLSLVCEFSFLRRSPDLRIPRSLPRLPLGLYIEPYEESTSVCLALVLQTCCLVGLSPGRVPERGDINRRELRLRSAASYGRRCNSDVTRTFVFLQQATSSICVSNSRTRRAMIVKLPPSS